MLFLVDTGRRVDALVSIFNAESRIVAQGVLSVSLTVSFLIPVEFLIRYEFLSCTIFERETDDSAFALISRHRCRDFRIWLSFLG